MNAPLSPAVLLDMVQRERDRRAAQRSLYEFVKQAWSTVEPGVKFIASWHIEAICEHLEAITHGQLRKLLINIPPRHSKSTIVSVMWPMWEWLHNPAEKYLCASYSGTLSIRDNLKARRLVQSPWYQDRWGAQFELAGDQNAKQRFENDKTGYRLATSVGGTATGEGGSRLILDDPHSAQEANSDAMRESALEWFDVVWSTRLNDPKRDAMVTVMQRLHERDVSGHILEDIGGWEHICIPAEWDGRARKTSLGAYDPRTKRGDLICPERFGEKEVTELKQLLGTYGAAGQLQQEPSPAEGGILKTRHFRLWPAEKPLPQFEYVLQSYDTAFGQKDENDPTGCEVWGMFTYEGSRQGMLLDAWDERLTYPELRQRVIRDWNTEYGGTSGAQRGQVTRAVRPSRILVEAKASGQSLLQDLRLARVPAVGYNPGTADKVSRAHQAAPTLELGILWVPESAKNPGQPVSWAAAFMRQLEKFPVAEHDEYVDCFTQAVIFLKNDGWFELPQASDRDEPRRRAPNAERANPYAA
jgi:predicted phage terminase large subunit-like protein